AEDGIRDFHVTGVQTCALPILTIATGTFTAVDLADAAIRAGMKSGGNLATFGVQLVLRVNFIGIGRFAFAVYSDVSMGAQRGSRSEGRRVEKGGGPRLAGLLFY